MHRQMWSSSSTYWRQDASIKKEEILFVWQENLALLGQLGKLAPGPESAAMLKQLALKKDARIKRAYPPRTMSSLIRCISASKSILQLQNTQLIVLVSPAFAKWRTTACLCSTGCVNCCPPLSMPIPRPKSRQMPGIFRCLPSSAAHPTPSAGTAGNKRTL